MRDDIFGDAPEQEAEPRVKVIWPGRPINQIESDLTYAMYEGLTLAEHRAPVIFIEDDTFANADAYAAIYGEPLTAREAMTLQDMVRGEVIEKFRRQLIVARECGEHAKLADYVTACMAEGIEPLTERLSKCQ